MIERKKKKVEEVIASKRKKEKKEKKRMKEWKKKRDGSVEHNDAVVADHVTRWCSFHLTSTYNKNKHKISQSNFFQFF